jgi:YHS domain-containing protein
MVLLSWLFRILLILLVVRLVLRFASGVLQGLRGTGPAQPVSERARSRRAVPLVKDPVCGTYVVREKALTSAAGGSSHYFCSDACRRTFERGARSRTA